jgi:exonuclease SbcD
MLRLLHTADVHLGARHTDMGERAAQLRERQFAAFRASVDLALDRKVDLFLVAGDLFDSNTQPRRSVERVAAELGRLVLGGVRTVIIPGTHDVYDGASIYRSYDLPRLAAAADGWITVLTPQRPEILFPSLDAVVYGRIFETKHAPASPLAGLDARSETRAAWRIGMVHGALAIPGRTDADAVVVGPDEIGSSGLDYLALGHWHNAMEGRAGDVTWAYSGAPEPVALDQDGAGFVLVVTLDLRDGHRVVQAARERVGRTRMQRLDLDASGLRSQPELVERLKGSADPDLVLDVHLTGFRPDDLDLDVDEVVRELEPSFLKFRLRDDSIPALPVGPEAPADTVLGAFTRNVEARMAELRLVARGVAPGATATSDSGPPDVGDPGGGLPEGARGRARSVTPAPALEPEEELADLREVLRLGRHLLEGREVTL